MTENFASGNYISPVGRQKATWAFFFILSPALQVKFLFWALHYQQNVTIPRFKPTLETILKDSLEGWIC